MNGPRRIQIQRQYTGPAPTIGAAPTSSPEPTSARYLATKAAKQAMDRYTVSQKPRSPRYAGPMAPRNGGRVNGGGANGGANGGAGVGAGAVATSSPGAWWQNPYIWGAAIAIYLFTMKARKK